MRFKKYLNFLFVTAILASSALVIANPNSFEEGKTIGNDNKAALFNMIQGGSALDTIPRFGSIGSIGGVNLQQYYSGEGRDTPEAITQLINKGAMVRDEACAEGDLSCSGRSFVKERHSESRVNNYKSIALQMRSELNLENAESILGLNNLPTSGPSTTCVETTTTLPDSSEIKSCLDATLQQTVYFSKLPTTVGYSYTSPSCFGLDGYTLSADLSTCTKDTYSCPQGSVLNGTECIQTTAPSIQYTGEVDCKNTTLTRWGYSRSRNTMQINCEGNNITVTARGAGSDGGGIVHGDFYKEIDLNRKYNATPMVPVAGDWSGSQKQGTLDATGECKDGTCSYIFRMGRSSNAWAQPSVSWYCPEGSVLNVPQASWRPARCDFSARGVPTINATKIYSCSNRYTLENQPLQDRVKGAYGVVCGNLTSSLGRIWQVRSTFPRVTFKDPRVPKKVCPNGAILTADNVCKLIFPATLSVERERSGCLGGQVTSAGEIIVSEEVLVDGSQSGGIKTCKAELYSCPSGMAMNGNLCEDANRLQYINDSKCVNLGYSPDNQTEGFLCIKKELDECSSMPLDCIETSSECIYKDKIPLSPTFGQCIATERTYECPVLGKTSTVENCSFTPMCIDGNCFDTNQKECSIIPGVNPLRNYNEVCQNLTKEEIEVCPVHYIYGEPDESGDRPIIGAEVDINTCKWASESNCTLAPITQQINLDGNSYWPTEASFSCLGDTLELCEELDVDPECSLTRINNEQYSIDGGTPIVISKHFSCERNITVANDTCTEDFALMSVAMEASRQAGNYLDPDDLKIFKGEYHRCDRRTAGFAGSSLGSKSCCNISAPDPEHNQDVLSEIKSSFIMTGAKSLIDYSIDTGSTYVYDYMMNSSLYQEVSALFMGAASTAATTASQADMLAEQTADFETTSYGVSYAGFGISYVGTGAASGLSGAVSGGGATGVSSYGLGGGFQLQFSPVGLYIYAAIKLYQAYQEALACDEEDYKTATLSKGKLCYKTRTWCAKEDSGLFGSSCTTYRTDKCCFNSKLARIVNEQGRKQLNLDMRDCGGFTLDQIQQLDWAEIDLTEFISDMLDVAQGNLPSTSDLERLTNKILNNVNQSNNEGGQPIDLGVDGNRRVHN